MKSRGRGRGKPSFVPPPPPDLRQFGGGGRDSDASFASSRPSSVGVGRSSAAADLVNDRSYQQSAARAVNCYLSSHAFPVLIKTALPSAKNITAIFNFVISQLDYPNPKMEEDLPVLLRSLNCPFKVNKSALRTPATPHAWPTLVAILHWLIQIASYNEHLASKFPTFGDNTMDEYALQSYLHFIGGDDESVDALDSEFVEKLELERNNLAENVKSLEKNAAEVEATVKKLRTGPSERESREKQKEVLEEDVNKFNKMIEGIKKRISAREEELKEKEKEWKAKEDENMRLRKENEELKEKIQLQTFNSRDVERMKKELQAVEGEIADAEIERNKYQEKCWDLNRTLGLKFKELEELAKECNKAVRKLKLGSDYQYELNAKGSTPAEVMGIDYKSTLKPAFDLHPKDINKSSVEKLEELIILQQQSKENAARIEEKRNRVVQLNSRVDELEGQINLLKQEMQDYIHRCGVKVQRMVEDVEEEAQNLNTVEIDAAEGLETAKIKQQEAIKESEEEIQKCACELFSLVDMVSRHKEYMECKILEMKTGLSEAANAISADYRASLPAQMSSII